MCSLAIVVQFSDQICAVPYYAKIQSLYLLYILCCTFSSLCGAPLTDWQACVWDLGSPSVHADKGKPAKILFKITIPHQLLPHLCPANRGIKIEEDSFVPSFPAVIRR